MAAGRATGAAAGERLTPEGARLLRFVAVGLSNTLITLAAYAASVGLGDFYVIAGIVGWTLGIVNGYFWNRTWTFRAGPRQHEFLAKYSVVGIVGLCVNRGLLAMAVDLLGASKLGGQAIVLPFVVLASFLANRFWTFDEHMEGPAPAPARSY